MTAPVNPGIFLRNIIPEEIYANSENFVLFLKAYYEWLTTATLKFVNLNGTFQQNERVIGTVSGATAKIKQVKSGEIVVILDNNVPFENFENLIGVSSGATCTLDSLNDNVLSLTNNLLSYKDVRNSVDKFSSYLKDEFFYNLPTNYFGNKRLVARKMRDFYESKGHEDSYKFLMKILYNQDIEISYPGRDILIPSDGKYEKKFILRTSIVASLGDREPFEFLFKTVRGETSGAIGNVIDIKRYFLDSIEIVEMTLNFVSGTFQTGETIYDIDDPLGIIGLYTTVYGVLSGYTVNFGGSGYVAGDFLEVIGDGSSAKIKVSTTFNSGIDRIIVNSIGHGYRLGTYATIDNANTGGTDLKIKVTGLANTYSVTDGSNTFVVGEISQISIVNSGKDYYDVPTITLVDSTISDIGLLSDKLISIDSPGNSYTIGENITFSSTFGTGALAEIASVVESDPLLDYNIYLEDESKLLQEQTYDFIKYDRSDSLASVWSGVGPISRIRMINFGSGYKLNDLPAVNISTGSGFGATLTVTSIQGNGSNVVVDVANNTGGIGAIKSLEIVDFGVNYTSANTTIDASIAGNGDANVSAVITGLGETEGDFINDDGKVGYKIIQDSYFYQKYSYVIKSGIELGKYKSILKKLIHPAGLEVFGEISIVNDIDVRMESDDIITVNNVSNFILKLLESLLLLPVEKVDDISDSLATLADTSILDLASQQIIEYENETFASQFGPVVYEQYQKNIPISGLANVYVANTTMIGTGTTFLSYFARGSEVVIDGNKFKVVGTTTNGTLTDTKMLLNVAPPSNITNKTVYRLSTLRR